MTMNARTNRALFTILLVAASLCVAPMSAAQARTAEPDATAQPAAQAPAPEGPAAVDPSDRAPARASASDDSLTPPKTGRGLKIAGAVFTILGTVNGVLCTYGTTRPSASGGGIITCGVSVVQLGLGLGLMLGGRKRAKRYAEWKLAHPHAVSVAPMIPNARTGAPGGLSLNLRF